MPRAPQPTTSRARSARQASTSLAGRPNYKDQGSDRDGEDDPIEGSSGRVRVASGGPGAGGFSSYNPLGDMGDSDDDQEGNPDELTAILQHFNKRTTKAEKEEQKKLANQWTTSVQTGVDLTDELINTITVRVDARLAAFNKARQTDHDKTEHYQNLLTQLDEQAEQVVSQLDKNAAQLSPKKNSEFKMVDAVLSHRAERIELAKQDYDASLEKHATEEIEMARMYAQSGPQIMRAFKKLLLA